MTQIKAVPTNIITGFLGVGKTSVILKLLKHKPANERWAVLVNEFGEVGIDGALMSGQTDEQEGVFIKELPGGCMCCASGVPMQIALNMLLLKAKPDRLLIEPTGLGHPKEVIDILKSDSYADVLKLGPTITLVDARKISDERYTANDIFLQQLEVADNIVANKSDLYVADEWQALQSFLNAKALSGTGLYQIAHANLDANLLLGSSAKTPVQPACHAKHDHNHTEEKFVNTDQPFLAELPDSGFLRIENSGAGFESTGWRFAHNRVFSRVALKTLFFGLEVERLKAVMITDQGIFAYNMADGAVNEYSLDETEESCVEVISECISHEMANTLELNLLNAITKL